jgi:hypothetical protein
MRELASVHSCSLLSRDAGIEVKAARMMRNTLKGNATGSTANAQDITMMSCSGSNNALQWTSGTGPTCATISGTETRQTMGSYCNTQQAASATSYYALDGLCPSASATELTVNKYVAMGGTFKNLGCVVANAPGTGQSDICSLRVDGGPTSVTCTISNSSTSCTDITHTASILAGHSGDYQVVTSSGATATRVFPYIEFDNP